MIAPVALITVLIFTDCGTETSEEQKHLITLQNRIRQNACKIEAVKPHNAFLICPEAEKVYAAVPHGFIIQYGELLMEAAFEDNF